MAQQYAMSTQGRTTGFNEPRRGQQFYMIWQCAFFVAALCVVTASICSMFAVVTQFKWMPCKLVVECFTLLFGLLMVVMEFPAQPQFLLKYRKNIYVYFLFMTRFTGRGIWYMFLGAEVFIMLWGYGTETGVKTNRFMGFFMGGYMLVLGAASVVFGIYVSLRLNKVRDQLRKGQQHDVYGSSIITPEKFKQMANDVASETFSAEETSYIINALSSEACLHGYGQPAGISPQDYHFWLDDSSMAVL